MHPKTLLCIAIIMLLLAIALGAFGAHAWQKILDLHGTAKIFSTASQYHFYLALCLLSLAVYAHLPTAVHLKSTPWLLVIGTVLFSGSLYILALTDIRWLGAITPIGGSLLLIGLGLFAFRLFIAKKDSS